MTKLSGYTPNAEAIAAYKPDLVVTSLDSERPASKALGEARDPGPARAAGGEPRRVPTGRSRQLGRATGHTAGAAAIVAALKRKIAAIAAAAPKASKLSFYEELSPDYYSATSTTFGGQVLKLLGLRNIADAADKSGSGYPKLSAEYIVVGEPRPDRPRRHEVLRPDRGEGGARRRAGARSPRSRTAASSLSATTSPRAGDRGSSTSCRRSRSGCARSRPGKRCA